MEDWLPRPKGKDMGVLLDCLRNTGTLIKRSSFDAIALPKYIKVDFKDSEQVKRNLPDMIFISIKTVNQDGLAAIFQAPFSPLPKVKLQLLTRWAKSIR